MWIVIEATLRSGEIDRNRNSSGMTGSIGRNQRTQNRITLG
jgi:hypothetical protein